MKLRSKKGWKSIVPRRFRGKLDKQFPLFSKAKSSTFSNGQAPVYLNVYDLTPINGYLYWAGLGIFHSGVQVHGVEYAFGAHDLPTSGVFEVEPRHFPGFRFRKSLFIGTTSLNPKQARKFVERHTSGYTGDSYHLIVKNCNHFSKDLCYKLTGKKTPKWVNRLANTGSKCSCLLPETLKVTKVKQDGSVVANGSKKRRLKNKKRALTQMKNSVSSCKPERSKKRALTQANGVRKLCLGSSSCPCKRSTN